MGREVFMCIIILLLHAVIYVKTFIEQSSLNRTNGQNHEKISHDIFTVE